MKPMNANELLAGLALARPVPITAVVTDSRKVQPGCIFVCFPGERVDGHDYAAKAYQAGAEYVIANHPVEGVPEDHLVICESSYLAMIRMASNYRTLFSPLMIGVTGSVGKTTTKEFCYAVLSAFGNTLKTEGNQNNEIGLPNTLFRLEDTTQYAVVEMGMSHLGEIARLVRAARPSAGIITMIGVSHLENLGTRENILKAKMEICQGLPDGAPLVLNADDDLLPTAQIPGRLRPVWFGIRSSSADVRAINIHTVGEGTGFTLVDNVDGETYEFSVTIPTAGVHTVYDALAAYTAATRLGLERARAARGHDRSLRPEHVEFPVADAEAHRPDTAAPVHEQPGARDAVVHVGAALECLFRHDRLKLLAVDGNVPFAAVAHVSVPVSQDGQAPAFEVFHGLVQLLGIGKGEILAERPPSHLRTAPPDQIFRRLPFGDVRVDGVHACGTGAGTHDLRLFHDHDLERGIKLRRFRRHETPGVAAADDQEIACDDLHFDV